jgi:hypothetical protein
MLGNSGKSCSKAAFFQTQSRNFMDKGCVTEQDYFPWSYVRQSNVRVLYPLVMTSVFDDELFGSFSRPCYNLAVVG